MGGSSHLDEHGRARMVDVGEKSPSVRRAVASARVLTRPDVIAVIRDGTAAKGDVLAAARLAGIQAAKRTPELIPLCHPLLLDAVTVDLHLAADRVELRSEVRCTGRTGVEMEALCAVSVAALTVYDMCKSMDRRIRIDGVRLEHKSGGKSGTYDRRQQEQTPLAGRVLAVCTSRAKGEAKTDAGSAELVADHGLRDDAHAGGWHRQVSLLAAERIEEMRRRGLDLEAGAFGENLVVAGLDLGQLRPGDRLRVGERIELEVTQLGKECHTPCAIFHQVGYCIMPEHGVFARVLRGGTVRNGDPIERLRGPE